MTPHWIVRLLIGDRLRRSDRALRHLLVLFVVLVGFSTIPLDAGWSQSSNPPSASPRRQLASPQREDVLRDILNRLIRLEQRLDDEDKGLATETQGLNGARQDFKELSGQVETSLSTAKMESGELETLKQHEADYLSRTNLIVTLVSCVFVLFGIAVTAVTLIVTIRTERAAKDQAEAEVRNLSSDVNKTLKDTITKSEEKLESMIKDCSSDMQSRITAGETTIHKLVNAAENIKDDTESFAADAKSNIESLLKRAHEAEDRALGHADTITKLRETIEADISLYKAAALVAMAADMQQSGNYLEAIETYDQVIADLQHSKDQRGPRQVAMALYNKGIALYKLKRMSDAIAVYDEAVRLVGNSDDAELRQIAGRVLVAKAMALQDASDVEGKLACLKKAKHDFEDAISQETLHWIDAELELGGKV